jgi:hypothetical protein
MAHDEVKKNQRPTTPWRVNVPAPRAWQVPIRSYALLNGLDIQEVIAQAIEALAREKGIKLPPRQTPRESGPPPEVDRGPYVMNSTVQ